MAKSLSTSAFVKPDKGNKVVLQNYTAVKSYSKADAEQEFKEELNSWKSNGKDSPLELRFPGVKREQVPFFFDPKAFAQTVMSSSIQYLSLSELQNVYNLAQTGELARAIEKGAKLEELVQKNKDFYAPLTSDPDVNGKTFNKVESFERWCQFIKSKTPILPTILLHCNGKYFHVVGQTRLVAGLSCGYIMPCLVIEA